MPVHCPHRSCASHILSNMVRNYGPCILTQAHRLCSMARRGQNSKYCSCSTAPCKRTCCQNHSVMAIHWKHWSCKHLYIAVTTQNSSNMVALGVSSACMASCGTCHTLPQLSPTNCNMLFWVLLFLFIFNQFDQHTAQGLLNRSVRLFAAMMPCFPSINERCNQPCQNKNPKTSCF